jgi:hypothetical protein
VTQGTWIVGAFHGVKDFEGDLLEVVLWFLAKLALLSKSARYLNSAI